MSTGVFDARLSPRRCRRVHHSWQPSVFGKSLKTMINTCEPERLVVCVGWRVWGAVGGWVGGGWGGRRGRGGGGGEVVVVVVLTTVLRTCLCRCERIAHAPNWVAESLGASSRRPRHPFPALMAGVSPGRVPVHTALKNQTPRRPTRAHRQPCPKVSANCGDSTVSALSGPSQHLSVQACIPCPRTAPV